MLVGDIEQVLNACNWDFDADAIWVRILMLWFIHFKIGLQHCGKVVNLFIGSDYIFI